MSAVRRVAMSALALTTVVTGLTSVPTASAAPLLAAPASSAVGTDITRPVAPPASRASVRPSAYVIRGSKIIAIAAKYRGIRYRAGGTSPRTGFDCSGFTRFIYSRLGISIPRVSRAQAHFARHLTRAQAVPGDLVFFRSSSGRIYHVAIYAGHNRVWHSPHTGSHVKRERIWASSVSFGRIR